MIQIPMSYYKNDTVHKLVGNNPQYGNISCGFLHKTSRKESNYHTIFEDYGGLLLLDGKGVHVNHKGEKFELYPGCFIQRRPGKCHHTYVEPDGRWLEFFICFGKDIFKNMVNLGMASGDQDVLYPGLSYGIFENMKELLEKFRTAKEHEIPHLLFECQEMIYQIYGLHKKNSGLQDQMLYDMCSLLKKYSHTRIPLEDVCQELNMGYETFRKLFKEKMGISPNRYVVQERINMAKTILLDEQYTIKEIAIQLGYSDPFTFSKQFKEITGISPKMFRGSY